MPCFLIVPAALAVRRFIFRPEAVVFFFSAHGSLSSPFTAHIAVVLLVAFFFGSAGLAL